MNLKLFVVILSGICLLLVLSADAQTTVSGTVSDVSGGLPGANVMIKGTIQGTTTDLDGKYSLDVPSNTTLVFSYIGFENQEIAVNGRSIIDVQLEEKSSFLDEVVVTGYETVSKRSFTGAAQTIKFEDAKIEGFADASRMLEGRVAGVSVQNVSGTFGAGPRITVRGSSTVLGDAKPLWVIDGVVQEDVINLSTDDLTSGNSATLIGSSVAGVNANDIQSIEVLKDASAVSLYGARALNGVIVVSTKGGAKDTPLQINYSSEYTMRGIPTYAEYDILDSKENMTILKEIEAKGFLGLEKISQGRRGGVYYIMYDRINTFDEATQTYLLENTPEARNKFLQQYELANTNWFETLFKSTVRQSHTLSFSGGGKKNVYFASIGYYFDPGWTIADDVSRITLNLKNTFNVSDKLSVTVSALGSIRQQRAPGTFERKEDVVNGSANRDFDINPFNYALNSSRTLRPRNSQGELEYTRNDWAPFNILHELSQNTLGIDVKDIRLQADIRYAITDKIKYNMTAMVRYVTTARQHDTKDQSNVALAYRAQETTIVRDDNSFLYSDPDNPQYPPVSALPNGGIYSKTDNTLTNYYIRNAIHYDNVFNNVHGVSVFLGQEVRYIDRQNNSFTGYGLQYSLGYTPFTDPKIIAKTIDEGNDYFSISHAKERTASFFTRATYSYDNRYIVSLVGRYDGSNQQGRSISSRWLPTWTASAKWSISDEAFMRPYENTISNLQLRVSYGLNATAGRATNSLAIFGARVTPRLSAADRESQLYIEDLQNTELTWEKKYEVNVGIDVGLYAGRIQLSADMYRRDGFDLIDNIRTSGIGGEFIKQANNADMVTEGVELSLASTNIATTHFKWKTIFNFSTFRQNITKLQDIPIALDLVNENGGNVVGYARQSLFSFRFTGLNEKGLPTFDIPDENKVSGVDFQDNEDVLNYLKYEGPTAPNTSLGFSNIFTYKNWSLSIYISGAMGNKIRLAPRYADRYSDLSVFTKDFANRWLLPGDENKTDIPVIASQRMRTDDTSLGKAYNAYNFSSVRVADGSFLRMKNISLGYNFPKKIIEKFWLSNLSIKIMATNLFLIYADSKLNGQDPEFFRSGGVAYPIVRQFTLSLNAGFRSKKQ